MSDKIKTFTLGLSGDYISTFEKLDELVAGLGDINIKSFEDKYYIVSGRTHDSARPGDEVVTRVVVYTQNPNGNIPRSPLR